MSFEIWLAFAFACTVLVVIPGPTVLLVVAYALGAGRRTALWTVIGVFFGDLVAITASVLGLGVLLAASATLFIVLKFVGGAYLIYLGFKLFTAPVVAGRIEAKAAAASGPKMALHAFAVTATNPKGLVFFVAFLPQFLNPAAPAAPQLMIMVVTFTIIAAVNALIYAMAAGGLRTRITQPAVLKWMNRGGGSALMAMGAVTMLARRV
jgi:threonine/homoserine/homoserine lactone efflux protein